MSAKVYLLIHFAGQDDPNTILGAFSSREAAQATLDAMNAVPWEVSPGDDANPHDADHATRRMNIEGSAFQHVEHVLRWVSDRPTRPEWPPKSPTRIIEYDLFGAPARVEGETEEAWIERITKERDR